MCYKIPLFVLVLLMLWLADQVNAQEFVTDGLISFWTFDGDTIDGNTVNDVWGSNHGESVDTKIVDGKIGQALAFNGSSSLVSIPDAPVFELTDAIALEAWVNINLWEVPNRHIIMAKYNQDQTKRYVQFAMKNDVGLSAFLGYSNGSAYMQVQAGNKPAEWVGEWVHVALTWDKSDGGVPLLYANGKRLEKYQDQQKLEDDLSLNDLPWTIGAMPGFDRFFSGMIDEVRIYNRRLTDEEIERNFNAKSNSVAVQPAGKLAATWGEAKLWNLYH
jgi:hypothetical protein